MVAQLAAIQVNVPPKHRPGGPRPHEFSCLPRPQSRARPVVATALPPSGLPGLPGRVGPGQTSTDKRRRPVASGWQALPLDYRRGIILPFPALPLRVAPEHPGKPRGISTALGRRQRGRDEGTEVQARGPAGIQGAGPGSGVLPRLAPSSPGSLKACCGLGARWDTALLSPGPGPWPAQTY